MIFRKLKERQERNARLHGRCENCGRPFTRSPAPDMNYGVHSNCFLSRLPFYRQGEDVQLPLLLAILAGALFIVDKVLK